MAINVSVHYNGGLLLDIVLLIFPDYFGESFSYDEEFLSLHQKFPLKSFDNVSPEGRCSEGLDAFRPKNTKRGRSNPIQ